MRIILFVTVVLVGCYQKEENIDVDYIGVQKSLTNQEFFKKFGGLSIIPREKDLYMVMLRNPNTSFFTDYSKDYRMNARERQELIDSLSVSDLPRAASRADSIIDHIEGLILFMKQHSIRSTSCFSQISDTESYCIDFYLSRNQYLRYYHELGAEKKSYPDDVIEAKWIDSSWVFLKAQATDNN